MIFIIKCLLSFIKFFRDFDFVYYILYILFAIGGLAIHPFLFAFQLTDFLRIGLLKNVVKAVWIPKKQLFLTFVVFILQEYYFGLLSYLYWHEQYEGKCKAYWMCWLVTFDESFKVSLFFNLNN